MRQFIIIFALGLLGVLAACSPVPPIGAENTEPTEPANPTSLPSPEATDPSDTQDSAPEEEGTPVPDDDKRQLPWNTDPEALIISATFCCGFSPQLAVTNYIPDAQVWGDGRVVWVEQHEDGSRTVWEGYIDLGELELLLNRFRDAGFYEWEDYYANQQISDLADQCIQVSLIDKKKSVCEYYEGAPDAFHELYDLLLKGAGASEAEEYVPESGFLTVIPLGTEAQIESVNVALEWETSELGVSLSEVGEGVWVKGPSLEAAWAAVNFKPWNPIVREGDSFYMVGLQVPPMSMIEPSAN